MNGVSKARNEEGRRVEGERGKKNERGKGPK
jgi:hypothetical protein